MISKIISVLFLINCSVQFLDAAAAYGPSEVHPDFPNQCYVSETNRLYKPGKEWPMDDTCGSITCTQDGQKRLFLEYVSCGLASVEPPCVLESNLALPYPHCCPQPKCPDDPIISTEIETNEKGVHDNTLTQTVDDEPLVSYDVSLDDEVQPEEHIQIPKGLFRPYQHPAFDKMVPR